MPDGRISRAGVAEVRRELQSRVGYLNRTADEKVMQDFIKRFDPNVELTTESLAELKTMAMTAIESATSASETITQEGNEMAETAKSPDVDVERVREMNRIEASDPQVRLALQRRDTQVLTPQQATQVKRYRELEFAHNEQARKEQHSKGGWMSSRPPRSIGSDVQAWLNNPHKVQRQQLAAEYKTKTLANPDHDYWHPERGTLCDNAKLGMKIAYEVAETGDCHGVQIASDGSISEGE